MSRKLKTKLKKKNERHCRRFKVNGRSFWLLGYQGLGREAPE